MTYFIYFILLFFSSLGFAQLSMSPNPVNGKITLTSSGAIIYFSNIGTTEQNVSLQIESNSLGISIAANRCPNVLKPKKTCSIIVNYPNYNKKNPSTSVSLKNLGSHISQIEYSQSLSPENASISVNVSNIDFGTFLKPSSSSIKSLTITNNGNIQVSPVISFPSNVDVVLNRCINLAPNKSCVISLKFNAISSLQNGQQSGLVFTAKPLLSSSALSIVNLSANINFNFIQPVLSSVAISSDKKTFTLTGTNFQNVSLVKLLNNSLVEVDTLIIQTKTSTQLILKLSKDISILTGIDYTFRLL